MKKDFLNFSMDDFLNDKDFISFVLRGENSENWNKILLSSDKLSEESLKAKRIIELLHVEEVTLDEEVKKTLWNVIHQYEKNYRQKTKMRKINRVLSYAAIFIAVISIGGIAAWYYSQSSSSFQFSDMNIAGNSDEARLVLKSGEEILLEKANSSIEIRSAEEVRINEEKILNIKEASGGKSISKMNEVIIPYGKKSQLILSDGTKVWLNAGTRFAFPDEFSGKTREVYVEGEAYFEVAHNPSQAFIVKAHDISVKVMGTHFNVRSYSNDMRVETLLLEGSVLVYENSSSGFGSKREKKIEPSQVMVFIKRNKTFEVRTVENPESYIAWKDGWFNFSGENILSVLRKMERYYNVSFKIQGNLRSVDRISGKLDLKESITDVMQVLSDLAGINYKIEDNVVTITQNN